MRLAAIALLLLLATTSTHAAVVISTSSMSAFDTDGMVTLSVDIHDTTDPPRIINTADLAIAIGDGGTALGGSDPITILDLDFSTGLFGDNADANYGSANPAFGSGATIRGVQSSTGVQLTGTPQRLASLKLGNLMVGDWGINLDATGRTEVGRSGTGALADLSTPDVAATRLTVSAVPEPSSFLFLGLVSLASIGCKRINSRRIQTRA